MDGEHKDISSCILAIVDQLPFNLLIHHLQPRCKWIMAIAFQFPQSGCILNYSTRDDARDPSNLALRQYLQNISSAKKSVSPS